MNETKRTPQALLIVIALVVATLVAFDLHAGNSRRAIRDLSLGAVFLVAGAWRARAREPLA